MLYVNNVIFNYIQINAQGNNGNFTLKARVHSYQNVLHTAVDNNGDCCDNETEDNPFSGCTNPCDNIFEFCLRDYKASTIGPDGTSNGLVNLTDCSRSNRAQTGVLEENNDSLTFTVGQPFPNSSNHSVVPNPVQLNGSNWTVSVVCINRVACL